MFGTVVFGQIYIAGWLDYTSFTHTIPTGPNYGPYFYGDVETT